jgi:hypothetical protein
MPYVLTRPGGGYLAMHGWTKNKAAALEFRSKEEALEHGRTNDMTGVLAEQVVPPAPPGVDPNGAASIFGYRSAPRG